MKLELHVFFFFFVFMEASEAIAMFSLFISTTDKRAPLEHLQPLLFIISAHCVVWN